LENRKEEKGDGAKRTKRETNPRKKGRSVWGARSSFIYIGHHLLPYIRRKERGRKGGEQGGKEEKLEKR
jgi:hypothetical protein